MSANYAHAVEDIQTAVESAKVYGSPAHWVDARIYEVAQDSGYVID